MWLDSQLSSILWLEYLDQIAFQDFMNLDIGIPTRDTHLRELTLLMLEI